ncbi:D-methionine transport system substrate-binding protein [Weissella uvarum]|uniref:MetQ/NlpA family ABC transporter substrate-binding protein n=1 Tax=Weissella uvarum TaxID=1479233 RepID=UPI001961802D|nr:MetQ/NlpA family ABC transporter substrate-binding protein [Weissella uvarum]MBM7617546.1 D-methionine transport system substrate-binding protein [Weissella uvarum]MCM0595572.1 MetQ/NlpA family ABC transporter substrate-binding protein [Weissella uvarum]
MRKGLRWTLGIGSVVAVFAAGIAGLRYMNNPTNSRTVTVGVVGDSDRQLWEKVKQDAKKDYDVNVKIKTFTDYVQPNRALVTGNIDLNAFQTVNYFNQQQDDLNHQMVDIGKTYVTPIRLYSEKHQKLSQIPKNGVITIPNDASNGQRAMDLLEKAGLLKYNHSAKLPSAKDVTSNPKHLKIKEVSSDQSIGTLKSADAAVINTNYALDAKLDVNKALYVEPVDQAHEGYFNLIAARKGTENRKVYRDVVKAYQSEKTVKNMHKLYVSAEQPAWGNYVK